MTEQEIREALNSLPEETRVNIAEAVKRAEYWSTVRGICDELRAEIKGGSITDEDGAREWLHESIDGCGEVIYTGRAMDVVRYSDNDDAYIDDFGEEGLVAHGTINWSGLAFCALMADVCETLGDLSELFEESEEEAEASTEA